jgi:MFS family permease
MRRSVWSVVGLLALMELASGILQGYYTPIYTDIAHHLGIRDADVNWFEAAQLIVSAILVPPLARLGDQVGHKRVLVWSTFVTAAATWGEVAAPGFGTFLVAWAVVGVYVVWLPIEVAVVYLRADGDEQLTRRGAALLVAVLELSVILGAGLSGAIVGPLPMAVVLAVPGVVVTLVWLAILRWLPATTPRSGGGLDWPGLGLLTLMLALLMGGLVVVRVQGPGSVLAWLLVLLGLATTVPFCRLEADTAEPLVDVRLLASRRQWPLQLVTGLFGMAVLGAQIPLSTFARTKPAAGYGLGAGAGYVSVLIALYVVTMAIGSFLYPPVARRLGEYRGLGCAALLVALGYALWLPLHASTGQGLVNMAVAGVGSGALLGGLPAAAAAAAPPDRTGMATGLTNAIKTLGGAIASAIFAIALSATGSIADPARGHAPLSGYLTVWGVCAAAGLVSAAVLFSVERSLSAGRVVTSGEATGAGA